MGIQLYDNVLTAEDFLYIHKEMQYAPDPREQIEQALKKGLFSVMAKDDEKIVGMGRLVGDGYMFFYIQDVRVLPQYQNKGIGKVIVNRLIDYACKSAISKTSISIGLMSAKGKESFYEKLGFSKLPSNNLGFGMTKDIDIEQQDAVLIENSLSGTAEVSALSKENYHSTL